MKTRKFCIALALLLSAATVFAQPKFVRKNARQNDFKQRTEYVISPSGISEQIIEHKGFVVSYNSVLLLPNWVTYELTADEAGATEASRTDTFTRDPDVMGRQADTKDYSNSGYDRGHMAPAADMKWNEKAMEESFYMTNICPQNKQLNSGLWLELEQKCRYWAKKYGPLYITVGPLFIESEGKSIGQNDVSVPDAFFKCLLQKRNGRWTGIVFVMPNIGCTGDLMGYAFPILGVESLTGFKMFANFTEDFDTELAVKGQYVKEDWIIQNWKKK